MNARSERPRYTPRPATDYDARIQGMAMVRDILNDPRDQIAKSIVRCPHTVDQRSQMIHTLLSIAKTNTNLVFIIATWCMLGGNTASTWAEGGDGQKPGEKETLMPWGKKMIEELEHLGRNPHFDFKICKSYVTDKVLRRFYSGIRAFRDYNNIYSPRTKRVGIAKRAADSSLEVAGPEKRRKTTAPREQSQQQAHLQAANEAQSQDIDRQAEEVTKNQMTDVGSSNSLFAKLSREELEAMNMDLRSRNERLEKQSAANLLSISEHSEEASALEHLFNKASKDIKTLKGRVRALNAEVHGKETLLEETTKTLEAAKQETARVKRLLNDIEVETITRIPGIGVVRKSTMNLKGAPESLEDEARLGSAGSNGV